jgi:hypothetical protein
MSVLSVEDSGCRADIADMTRERRQANKDDHQLALVWRHLTPFGECWLRAFGQRALD